LEQAAEILHGVLVVTVRYGQQRMKQQIKVKEMPLKKQVYLYMLTQPLGVFVVGKRTTAGLGRLSLSKSSSARASLSSCLPRTSP